MKHIHQPKGTGLCNVACAAMIMGKEFQWVFQRADLSREKGIQYLKMRNLYKYLLTRGYYLGTIFTWDGPVFSHEIIDKTMITCELDLRRSNCVICVESKSNNCTHSVIWDAKKLCVLDPAEQTHKSLSDYQILEIVPIVQIGEDRARQQNKEK